MSDVRTRKGCVAMCGASNDEEVFGKDLGLMHELAVTGRSIGFKAEDWGKLAHDREQLHRFLAVLRDEAKIVYEKLVVDTDADPTPMAGAVVWKHEKHGRLTFFAESLKLRPEWPVVRDSNGIVILNANVLDSLLAHPLMIPDQWRRLQEICFFGTLFKENGDPGEDCLMVRSMAWDEHQRRWSARYRSFALRNGPISHLLVAVLYV